MVLPFSFFFSIFFHDNPLAWPSLTSAHRVKPKPRAFAFAFARADETRRPRQRGVPARGRGAQGGVAAWLAELQRRGAGEKEVMDAMDAMDATKEGYVFCFFLVGRFFCCVFCFYSPYVVGFFFVFRFWLLGFRDNGNPQMGTMSAEMGMDQSVSPPGIGPQV